MKWKKEYLIVLIIQITEVLGFSLVLPFLPIYAKELGATPLLVGLIPASFSLLQFLSAPIMGKLSDSYGRKPLLILSQISTLISFVVLAFADSIELIFLSRAIDGLLGSNFTIAQAYLSDISEKKDRSKVFAISGIAFSVGFLIGPGVGGYLAKTSYSLPAFFSVAISLVTIILTIVFLKETVKVKKKFVFNLAEIVDIKAFTKYFGDKKVGSRLWEFFTFVLTHSVWTGQLSLYASIKFDLGTEVIGLGLAYVGLVNMIIRGVFFGKIIDKFGERTMKMVGFWSCLAAFVALGLAENPWMMLLVFTFFAFGGSFVRPTLTGEISRKVSDKEQGAILGVTSSLQSISQIFGPIMGGYILTHFAPNFMGWVPALIMIWGIWLATKNKNRI